jgi:integrase
MEEWWRLEALVASAKASVQSYEKHALRVLREVLVGLYGAPDLAKLQGQKLSIEFLERVARELARVMQSQQSQKTWSRKRQHKVINALRGLVRRTSVSPGVLRVLRTQRVRVPHGGVLRGAYARLATDDPVRLRLENWIQRLRDSTNNRSQRSLTEILSFWTSAVLPALGLDLRAWPDDVSQAVPRAIEACQSESVVRRLCDFRSVGMRTHWLQLFLSLILQSDAKLPRDLVRKLMRERRGQPQDESDGHRISNENLVKIHEQATKDPLSELLFMLLLTTGMRIGGFVRMKTRQVAKVVDGRWVGLAEGHTLEKGGRRFDFRMLPRVQELLAAWLNKRRPLSPASEYVFPGCHGEYMCTETFRARFKRLCHAAGLHGPEFHPHSLRHCFSHMLLEAGNPPETVSKLLGHTNVATTQKFYLRESSLEVCDRADIPWFRDSKRKAPGLPAFLVPRDLSHAQAVLEALEK